VTANAKKPAKRSSENMSPLTPASNMFVGSSLLIQAVIESGAALGCAAVEPAVVEDAAAALMVATVSGPGENRERNRGVRIIAKSPAAKSIPTNSRKARRP